VGAHVSLQFLLCHVVRAGRFGELDHSRGDAGPAAIIVCLNPFLLYGQFFG
jgi:hypothetical protein